MLDKKYRLKKNKQFQYIYKKGEKAFSKPLIVLYVKTRFTPFKVGIAVSNKIGKAVIRNSVKRKLREQFKILISQVNPHYNYVIVAKPGIELLSSKEVQKTFKYCLTKAGLLIEKDD